MRSPRSLPTGPRGWAWLGVLFLVLAGVIGMHGLGGHGVSHASTHATGHQRSSTVVEATHPPAGRHTTSANDVEVAQPAAQPITAAVVDLVGTAGDIATASAVLEVTGHGPSTGSMAELCLAVLVLGLTLTLLWLITRFSRNGLRLRRPEGPLIPSVVRRDRSPPSLTRLCIRRC